MSNTNKPKQFINITKPTYEHPFIHISGNGTYPLRSILRESEFDWKGDKKIWEKEFTTCIGITTNDLQNTASPIIDHITTEASFAGIQVHINNNNNNINTNPPPKPQCIDYNTITNTNNTYPDGTKIINKHIPKYYKDYSFDSVGIGENKSDQISATLNAINNTIEFRGSTYYNRQWLKTTLNAKWDKLNRVWYIPNGNNDILKQIERILDEFGIASPVLKFRINRNNRKNMNNRNVKKPFNHRNIKKINVNRLKRKYVSDNESSEEYDSDNNNNNKYRYRAMQPALKRRRIIESDNSDNPSIEILNTNNNNLSFVVDDDVIEYEDGVSDGDIDSSSDSDHNIDSDEDSDYVLPKSAKDVMDMSQDNVNIDAYEKKHKLMSQDNVNNNKEKEEEVKIDEECVVCMEKKKQYLGVPCGHLCLCEDCKDAVKRCPICRTALDSVIKLFK